MVQSTHRHEPDAHLQPVPSPGRHPRLELLFGEAPNTVLYKWSADENNFAMPIRVGTPDHWKTIHPTTNWQSMQTTLSKEDFQVPTDLYYVEVNKQ